MRNTHDEQVEAFVDQKGLSLLTRNILDYKAWQAGEELRSFSIGNLVFSPPWENGVIGKGETLVHIDPCVVFGTGYHPTTRSCLRALWEIYQKEKPEKVLDLGTGSGILALAAAKWGAKRVLAVDCNELAVETALRNVSSNGELERIEVRQGKAEDFIDEKADLVCANLHLRVIRLGRLQRAWPEYRRRYLEEMAARQALRGDAWVALVARRSVALCCYCENPLRCHRMLLAAILVERHGSVYEGEVVDERG